MNMDITFSSTILMEEYKNTLAVFCQYLAILNQQMWLKEQAEEPFDIRLIKETLNRISVYKERLLSIKEQLGFPGGLDFLGDNSYDGFAIINGRFTGNPDQAALITRKWLSGFPETANNYQYEASVYVMFMAFPMNPTLPRVSYSKREISILPLIKGGLKKCRKMLNLAS